jgi:RHS repeat-associated protein
LGSVLAVTDEAGTKLEQRHFDAWGSLTHLKIGAQATITDKNQIRDYLSAGNLVVDRGYTSHEHFAEVGLIHMNGRLYDPLLRRFLNADENIQDPHNTQNYNKYGYVMNNPLMYSDPSGEFAFIPFLVAAILKAVIISAISYTITAMITGDASKQGFLKSIGFAAVSAGLTYGVGEIFRVGGKVAQTLKEAGTMFARMGTHALIQGTLSLMQGGNFWSGGLSAAFSSLSVDMLKLAPNNSWLNHSASQFLTGAISGGVGSVLGQGNFWQGAIIGGIVTVFNHMAMHEPPNNFNDDYFNDPETGYRYYKLSDHLYEVYDQSLQPIGEKFISGIDIKYKFADVRQQMQGYKALGNTLIGLGFAMTIFGVGAPAGVVLMALGGGINTAVAIVNTSSYLGEKRYSKAAWEAGGLAASSATGGIVGKFGTVNKELFRGFNKELGKEAASFVAGDVGVPLIEHTTRTAY